LAEYSPFYRVLLQKRPIILRRLLIVATPYVTMYTLSTQIIQLTFKNEFYLAHHQVCGKKKGCIWEEKGKKKSMSSTCNESFLELPAYKLKKKRADVLESILPALNLLLSCLPQFKKRLI